MMGRRNFEHGGGAGGCKMNESGEKVETEERRRRSRSGERGGGRGGEKKE